MINCPKCGYGHKTFEEMDACKSWQEMKAEERDSVPSAPTCEADQGSTCRNRDCLVHKEIWDYHKRIEKAAAPTLEEEAREWRVTQWHVPSAAKIAPSQLHKYLALTTDQLDSMLAAFVRQRRRVEP